MSLDVHALANLRSIHSRLRSIADVANSSADALATRSFFGHVQRGRWHEAHVALRGVFPETNLAGRHLMDVAEQVDVLQPARGDIATRLRQRAGEMVAPGEPHTSANLPAHDTHYLRPMTPRADATRAAHLLRTIDAARADIDDAVRLLSEPTTRARAESLAAGVREAVASGRSLDAAERATLAAMRMDDFDAHPPRDVIDTVARTLASSELEAGRGWQYRGMLKLLRESLGQAKPHDAEAIGLARRIDEQAARNIAFTLDEVRHAGYQGHPNYGEVGEIASTAQLFVALERRAQPQAVPAAAGALVW